MVLFGSVIRQLLECFLRRETPQRAQQCAAQELAAEKLPEQREAFDSTANDLLQEEKYLLGEREEEREVKVNKGGSHKDEAEITLSLEKIKKRGRVHQKKIEMHSLENRKQKLTEPTPLLVEVKPVQTTVIYSFFKPIEGDLPMLPSVSGHLVLPAAHFEPLPPVTKPVHPQKPDPAPEDVLSLSRSLLQVDRDKPLAVLPCPDEVVSFRCSTSHVLPLVVPPSPTPAPDEQFSIHHSSSQVRHPKRLPPSPTPAPDEVIALQRPPSQKHQPFTSSLFEPPPQLMLIDIENEESEYVEYTGETIRGSDLLKSERPQTPEAEIKPRKTFAWLDKDSVAQDEAWASEMVEEVQAFEERAHGEMGDCKATQGFSDDAPQIDELPMKPNVNVQTKSKRKFCLITWAQEKAKKKQEKKILKEKKRREKEWLLERYLNDLKLQHL